MNISVDPDGYTRPCCISSQRLPYNLGHNTLAEIVNSPEMIKLRQDMIDGVLVKGCSECYIQEKLGGMSPRETHTNGWQFIPSVKEKVTNLSSVVPVTVEYFDLRFGNMCNLQCRSCTPYNSSQLAKELRELNIPVAVLEDMNTWYETEMFNDNIKSQLDNIKVLYIAGGEPTIIENNFKILEYLIEHDKAKDIILQINTNLTNVKPRFLNILSQFKCAILLVSIDGFGKVQEYLRYPSNWGQIDSNLHKLLALKSSNIYIKVTPVIQNVNLSNIVDLFEYLENFNRVAGKTVITIAPIILNNPSHSDIVYLPLEYKQDCWSKIEDWLDTAIYQSEDLRTAMNQVKEKCNITVDYQAQIDEFKRQTDLFDNHRNTFLQDINPELYKILYK